MSFSIKLLTIGFLLLSLNTTPLQADEGTGSQRFQNLKSLSHDEIQSYLDGKGLGFAKAAELNHYPGPRHLIDLRDELALSDIQLQNLQNIFDHMQEKAKELAVHLLENESKIEAFFIEKQTDELFLKQLLLTSAKIKADLRFTHLEAHLKAYPLLKPAQINTYDQLRGYNNQVHTPSHNQHHH